LHLQLKFSPLSEALLVLALKLKVKFCMQRSVVLHVEKDFHVKDIIRPKVDKGEKPGKWSTVTLAPPAGWLTLALRQLTGK
jgi:hypothetical protein